MPPKKTSSIQLSMAKTCESTPSLACRFTPITFGRVSVLLEYEINDEDQDYRIAQINEEEDQDEVVHNYNEDEH
jgi:hypothetical protein